MLHLLIAPLHSLQHPLGHPGGTVTFLCARIHYTMYSTLYCQTYIFAGLLISLPCQ